MSDLNSPKPKPTRDLPPPSSIDPSHPKASIRSSNGVGYSGGNSFPNPPDHVNPDPATLREQWRFAIRQYSKWYSHAWGAAILAGASFFAIGWIIKGGNPLPSFDSDQKRISSEDPKGDTNGK
ncbi:hypothetical protein DM860_001975 [Cuscuta australis]|uniref:Uncharacterized protein n=1 Tax=Cuscuta australis TaxID=267555 RepID=A0A328DVF7_9ASTE|nr:hypothetical protein DM860_001975 [Cuscuta australis]